MIDNIARGWNRDPHQSLSAVRPGGISAALWSNDAGARTELRADPQPDTHLLALRLSSNTAELEFNGRLVHTGQARIGSLSLLRSGDTARSINTGKWRVLHLYLPRTLVEQVSADEQIERHFRQVELESAGNLHDAVLERCAREILAEMHEAMPLARARIDCLGQEVVIQLLRSRIVDPAARRIPTASSDWRLKRAMELATDRLVEDVGVAELAEAAGLSRVHLTNLFRKATGLAPHQWILRARLEQVRSLLAGSGETMTEIALQCGFSSSQHLAMAFRKQFGMTPTAYRHMVRS